MGARIERSTHMTKQTKETKNMATNAVVAADTLVKGKLAVLARPAA